MEFMMQILLPCLYAGAACVAFTFVFNIHGWGKLICGAGGALGWLVYLLCGQSIPAAFLAAVSISLFSEVMARVRRCPRDRLPAGGAAAPGARRRYLLRNALLRGR